LRTQGTPFNLSASTPQRATTGAGAGASASASPRFAEDIGRGSSGVAPIREVIIEARAQLERARALNVHRDYRDDLESQIEDLATEIQDFLDLKDSIPESLDRLKDVMRRAAPQSGQQRQRRDRDDMEGL
jgi:hypothetical protein